MYRRGVIRAVLLVTLCIVVALLFHVTRITMVEFKRDIYNHSLCDRELQWAHDFLLSNVVLLSVAGGTGAILTCALWICRSTICGLVQCMQTSVHKCVRISLVIVWFVCLIGGVVVSSMLQLCFESIPPELKKMKDGLVACITFVFVMWLVLVVTHDSDGGDMSERTQVHSNFSIDDDDDDEANGGNISMDDLYIGLSSGDSVLGSKDGDEIRSVEVIFDRTVNGSSDSANEKENPLIVPADENSVYVKLLNDEH